MIALLTGALFGLDLFNDVLEEVVIPWRVNRLIQKTSKDGGLVEVPAGTLQLYLTGPEIEEAQRLEAAGGPEASKRLAKLKTRGWQRMQTQLRTQKRAGELS